MANGVFIHRADSVYDDRPDVRYQFPKQYLGRAEATVGDWIVYYEPQKVKETRGYFAVAKVANIIPDPGAPGLYVALIEAGSYLDFANPIQFKGPDGIVERGVLNDAGRISGRAQSAVRPLSAVDFARIVDLGISETTASLPRIGSSAALAGLGESQAPFRYEQDRSRVNYLSSRVLRDRVFRSVILRAYDSRCAVTGLRLINGGGRAEVEAAHIRPVEAHGPDIISNGLALSGTAHWMFDRGLISVADDLTVIISRKVNDIASVRAMINASCQLITPTRMTECPHPRFLDWHRQNCFKE